MLSENDCSNVVQSSSHDTLNTSSSSSNIKGSLSLVVEAATNIERNEEEQENEEKEMSLIESNISAESFNFSQIEMQTDVSTSAPNGKNISNFYFNIYN